MDGKTDLQQEINKRLTFAIISHPDAGKTTMTEKLLYFGGAIHMTGAVKAKRNSRNTVSDFMAMEQERGISISTSVMGFDYKGRRINLLDTPGHADFSEDTYRTLTAVDSALMMIDSVKGVEERTRKLCEVCAMRATPIITFMNKFDREGRDPLALLDQVEAELNIEVCPLTWPIGQGKEFKGVYDFPTGKLVLFQAHGHHAEGCVEIRDLDDPLLEKTVGSALADNLRENAMLISEVYPKFDKEAYLAGKLSPVFFGSALNNFGVQELLDCFADIAPPPVARPAKEREVQPQEEKFSGLVFKIHANLDPRHRDRIAFLRICSGIFEKNKSYLHVRSGKQYKCPNPTAFMAQDRNVIDCAYPGDIVGLHDTGTFKIGDSLSEGERIEFTGIPRFSPQLFKKVVNKNPLRDKQLKKGLAQLSEEGVIQLFTIISTKQMILGVVGALQFEVTQQRLANEYKAECIFDAVDYGIACWFNSEDKQAMEEFKKYYAGRVAEDIEGKLVFFARNQWLVERTMKDFPKIKYAYVSDEIEKA